MSGETRRLALGPNTLVPLSVIAVLSGGIYWVAMIATTVAEHEKRIEYDRTTKTRLEDQVNEIQQDVSAIDAKVSILLDMTKKQRRQ